VLKIIIIIHTNLHLKSICFVISDTKFHALKIEDGDKTIFIKNYFQIK